MTFLKKLGHVALQIITFGAIAAKDAAPIIAVFNPSLAALLTTTAQQIIAAEAAGTSAAANAPAGSTGAAKSALVIASIQPIAVQVAKEYGLANPSQEQLQNFVNGIVASLNAFGVDLASPSTTA